MTWTLPFIAAIKEEVLGLLSSGKGTAMQLRGVTGEWCVGWKSQLGLQEIGAIGSIKRSNRVHGNARSEWIGRSFQHPRRKCALPFFDELALERQLQSRGADDDGGEDAHSVRNQNYVSST